MIDESKTTEETARKLVAKLYNHTVSEYNIRIIAEALDEAYEDGLNDSGNRTIKVLKNKHRFHNGPRRLQEKIENDEHNQIMSGLINCDGVCL